MAPPTSQAPLDVASPGLVSGAALPTNNTRYGRNLSPLLSWSAGPAGTRSYVVAMEDADGHGPHPVVHWLVYGLAPGVLSLPKGLRNQGLLATPAGALQGANDHGSLGYSGPYPPMGDPPHHYHLQVFALDRGLKLAPGASRETLARAMRGHVLAQGELVTNYAAPAQKSGLKSTA